MVVKWFEPGKKLNWSKDDKPTTRRRNALKARRGNTLKTARALQALSNVTQDSGTKAKAAADARYFFARHKKESKS